MLCWVGLGNGAKEVAMTKRRSLIAMIALVAVGAMFASKSPTLQFYAGKIIGNGAVPGSAIVKGPGECAAGDSTCVAIAGSVAPAAEPALP